jgi:glycosyltransferase involved in cell wall biosynthesis
MRPLNIFVAHCSDLLTDHLPHGDGLVAHGFITSLARRGHRLHVAAQRVDLREPMHSNVAVHPIEIKRPKGVRGRLEYMLRVRRLLRRLRRTEQFDLIHQLNPVFTGVSLSLFGSGLPLVLGTYVGRWPEDPNALTARGGWSGRLLGHARTAIAAAQQRRADALVLTTPAAWNRLPDPDAVRQRVHVVPHGLDTNLFSPAHEWNTENALREDQSNPSILFLANVVKRKGIFTLLDAFPAVLRQSPNCRLVIAGGGPDLPEVRKQVTRLGCGKHIEFLGPQERHQTPELYRKCSVYCLPSFGEPYGTTVVEAMSCGKALVVTNIGALPHLVHEQGGLRVPAGDPVALAEALVWLLQHPEERTAMGRYNRDFVQANMPWDRVAQQLEQVYEATLSGRKSEMPAHHLRLEMEPRHSTQRRI